MVQATKQELEAIGVTETPGVAVADSGYWNEEQIDNVVSDGIQVLIPPDAASVTLPAPAGVVGVTRSCAPYLRPSAATGFTEDARRWSSPCSRKPSTIGGSTASNGEGDQRCARSGG